MEYRYKQTTKRHLSFINPKRLLKNHSLFFFILLLAIFLRVYRLEKLTTFGGDQGQDFLVVKNMVLYHKWTLLGIKTSIAPFFQGPLYLYVLYPFFVLFRLQPIAGPIAAVVVSTASIILLYITVNKYFSKRIAVFSSALFAVSPQLIKYGNTPLYQHFLPFFLIISFYLFFLAKKNILVSLLLGLSIGLGMELHFLNVIFGTALLFFFLLSKKGEIRLIPGYIIGLLAGLSPTILFELRHNFLNTNYLLNYQPTIHSNISITILLNQWIEGSAFFLAGNSLVLGLMILIFIMASILFKKIALPHYQELRNLTLILIIVSIASCIKFSTFEPHYLLPVWILSLVLLPLLIKQMFQAKTCMMIIGLLIISNLFSSVRELNNDHGYNMPSGWTMKKINLVGKIVSEDAQKHGNFNVASLLDGGTRAYPIRYTTEINGANPDRVENYPANDFLYVLSNENQEKLSENKTWEIVSLSPFTVGEKWNLEDNIYLYRLDRIKP